jgi:hypothetical protein
MRDDRRHCLNREQKALVRCCADTDADVELDLCKPDVSTQVRTNVMHLAKHGAGYQDGAANWTAARAVEGWSTIRPYNNESEAWALMWRGIQNFTLVPEQKLGDDLAVSKVSVASAAGVIWCLCSMWLIYLSRGFCEHHWKKNRAEAKEKKEESRRVDMRRHADATTLTGDIEMQLVVDSQRSPEGASLPTADDDDALRSSSMQAAEREKAWMRRSRRPSVGTLKSVLKFKGITQSPRQRQRSTRETWSKAGCSLDRLPMSVQALILSHIGDARVLAQRATVCQWWARLHLAAAKHLEVSHQQWQHPPSLPTALCHLMPRFVQLRSIDIVAKRQGLRRGLRPSAGAAGSSHPHGVILRDASSAQMLPLGACAEDIWGVLPITYLTLRADPELIKQQRLQDHGPVHRQSSAAADQRRRWHGVAADDGAKAVVVWELRRSFLSGLARSRSLTSLDLRHAHWASAADFDGWPQNLRVLSLRSCAHMTVFPSSADRVNAMSELRSLDLSRCTALYDISALLGATGLQWCVRSAAAAAVAAAAAATCVAITCVVAGNRARALLLALPLIVYLGRLSLSGCGELSNIGPIAACKELKTLNVAHCVNVSEISGELHVSAMLKPRKASATNCCMCRCGMGSDRHALAAVHARLVRLSRRGIGGRAWVVPCAAGAGSQLHNGHSALDGAAVSGAKQPDEARGMLEAQVAHDPWRLQSGQGFGSRIAEAPAWFTRVRETFHRR